MAYNSSKGPQQHGDVKYEGDPLDTQVDFENDFIALKTNGEQRFIVSGSFITSSIPLSCSVGMTAQSLNTATTVIDATHVSSSLNVSGSKFYGDGSTLSGVGPGTMSQFTLAGDGGSSQAIADGNTLTVAGGTGLSSTAGATDTVTVKLDDTSVSAGSYTYSAITVDAQGRLTAASNGAAPSVTTYSNAADNRVITSVDSTSIQGEAGLTYNGTILSAAGQVSASLGVTGSSLHTTTTAITTTHVSSSLNISGAAFYADGVLLTGGGAGAVSTYTNSGDNRIITSVNSNTINGEANLTYDAGTSFLAVSGTMEVSGTMRARTLEITRHTFQYGATSEIWIPFEHTGESNNPDWENQFVTAFAGELKRILVRPENTQNGNISASVWFAPNTVAEIDGGTRVSTAIGANAANYTTTTINFTGSNHFAPGDIVGVSITPRLNPGKINLTCIWEFDKTSF